MLSVVTAPFYTVAISMQLSVLPNLLIYGDVKPEQLKKGFLKRNLERIGVLKRAAIESNEKGLSKTVIEQRNLIL